MDERDIVTQVEDAKAHTFEFVRNDVEAAVPPLVIPPSGSTAPKQQPSPVHTTKKRAFSLSALSSMLFGADYFASSSSSAAAAPTTRNHKDNTEEKVVEIDFGMNDDEEELEDRTELYDDDDDGAVRVEAPPMLMPPSMLAATAAAAAATTPFASPLRFHSKSARQLHHLQQQQQQHQKQDEDDQDEDKAPWATPAGLQLEQETGYLQRVFARHLLPGCGGEDGDAHEWTAAMLTSTVFGIFRRTRHHRLCASSSSSSSKPSLSTALVLVSPRSCQELCEAQLRDDPLRVCALHITCTTRAIHFYRTTRTQQSLVFRTACTSGPLPFVESTVHAVGRVPQQAHVVARQVVDELRAVLANAGVLALTQPASPVVPRALLGVGSTSSVCQLEDGRVAKSVDFAHAKLFQQERSMLELVAGLSNVAQLDVAMADSLVLVTSPAGVSLNKLPWGSLRSGQGFAHLAMALQEMASRGVVHRDVSPGNIILVQEEQGTSSSLYLIDFGVAMVVQRGAAEALFRYSGSKFFASDAVLGQLTEWGGSAASQVRFGFLDDLESLVKTVVYCIDFECNNLITLASTKSTTGAAASPRDVEAVWQRIWTQTAVGAGVKRRLDEMRGLRQEEAHLFIAKWLEGMGWSAAWTGL